MDFVKATIVCLPLKMKEDMLDMRMFNPQEPTIDNCLFLSPFVLLPFHAINFYASPESAQPMLSSGGTQ